MDHAIDPAAEHASAEPAYRRFRDKPQRRFETRVRDMTGLQLIFSGVVTLLGLLIPAVLITGTAAAAGAPSGVAISGIVVGQLLGLIGIVVGVPVLIMGLIKFAHKVWKS